ncbi:MAG: tetratricopeptide repeat protein, partial [Acidobacteriota bacterium]
EVLARQHRAYTPPHLDIATTLNDLASVLRQLDRLEESEELFRQALDQRQAILSPDHPDVAQSLNNVGTALFVSGDYDGAGVLMKQAFEVWQKSYSGDHPRLCAALSNLGAVARRGERYPEAADFLAQALGMEIRLHGEEHSRVASARRRLGIVQVEAGEEAAGFANLQSAVDFFSSREGPGSAGGVTAGLSLAAAYREAGRSSEAEALLLRLEAATDGDETLQARVQQARGQD